MIPAIILFVFLILIASCVLFTTIIIMNDFISEFIDWLKKHE